MVKKIELYKDKFIDIDTDKIKKYIFNYFSIVLVSLFIIIPDYKFFKGTLSIKSTSIMYISTVFFVFLLFVKIFEKSIRVNTIDVMCLFYIIFIILSCLFSKYSENVVLATATRCEGLLVLFSYIMTFYIFKELFTYDKRIFIILTISLLLVSCYGIVQSFFSKMFVYNVNYMAFGTTSNANIFSGFLTLFLPIYLVKYLYTNKKLYLLICSIIFAALICSKTTTGYITFAIYFIILSAYFIAISKEKKKMVLRVMALLLSFIIVFLLLNLVNKNRYYKEIESSTNKNSLEYKEMGFGNGRLNIWKLTFDIIKKNPVFGVGPDCLGLEVFYNYMDKPNYFFKDIIVDKAHSEYLQIAATTGIPSLIVYITLIIHILVKLLTKFINVVREKGSLSNEAVFIVAITASTVAYLFQAGANISDPGVAPFFWAMLGVCLNASKFEQKDV